MLSSMCLPACCRAATHSRQQMSSHTPQTVSQEPKKSTGSRTPSTFVEVQLFFLLLLLLRLVVVGFGCHPLDLSGRLLPLAALVQGRFGSLADEVVGLCLGEYGGALPLQKELPFRRQTRKFYRQAWRRSNHQQEVGGVCVGSLLLLWLKDEGNFDVYLEVILKCSFQSPSTQLLRQFAELVQPVLIIK